MPFCTYYLETSKFFYLFLFGITLFFYFLVKVMEYFLLIWAIRRHPILLHFLPGHKIRIASQHYVGSTSSHVSSYSDCLQPSGLGNNVRFTFMVLGIKHIMGNLSCLEYFAYLLGVFNGCGSYKSRLALFPGLLYFIGYSRKFLIFRPVNNVWMILSYHGLICRNNYHTKTVN